MEPTLRLDSRRYYPMVTADVTQRVSWSPYAPQRHVTAGGIRRDARLMRVVAAEIACVLVVATALLAWRPAPIRPQNPQAARSASAIREPGAMVAGSRTAPRSAGPRASAPAPTRSGLHAPPVSAARPFLPPLSAIRATGQPLYVAPPAPLPPNPSTDYYR